MKDSLQDANHGFHNVSSDNSRRVKAQINSKACRCFESDRREERVEYNRCCGERNRSQDVRCKVANVPAQIACYAKRSHCIFNNETSWPEDADEDDKLKLHNNLPRSAAQKPARTKNADDQKSGVESERNA